MHNLTNFEMILICMKIYIIKCVWAVYLITGFYSNMMTFNIGACDRADINTIPNDLHFHKLLFIRFLPAYFTDSLLLDCVSCITFGSS